VGADAVGAGRPASSGGIWGGGSGASGDLPRRPGESNASYASRRGFAVVKIATSPKPNASLIGTGPGRGN